MTPTRIWVASHLSKLTPNCSRKTRCPFGVIVTARVPSMRQIHPCPKPCAHKAVPILPAMHECSNPFEANLVVIAMVVLVLELEHHEQIADCRAVYRHIGIVFVRNRIGKIVAAASAQRLPVPGALDEFYERD